MFGENAAWISELNLFYFGAGGNGFRSFVQGSDVAGHEFTHAVISSTSNLEYVGQSGALNEHFADLFGEMFQASFEEREPSFLIGETIAVGDVPPLRNMLVPGLGLSAQPGHMSEIPKKYSDNCVPSAENDRCGVHNLSGIPNKFAAQIVKQLGWLKVRDIFYRLMTENLTSTATFADYAREARKLSAEVLSPEDAKIVDASLISVGL
jgi:Zn-dependent metalloprotease